MVSAPNEQAKSESQSDDAPEVGGRYAWYVLIVLVIVYVFNFIDRGILSILAEEIKADIGVTDAQIGFLYGTAFAVFYAVFGIPLARLADVWTRKSLISIGLFFWSGMTALSGTARSLFSLGAYRIGVGVGEASASPAAFSMLGDYFSPKMRATAMAVYSSGVYIGAGLGLFIGGWVVDGWAALYPEGGSPMDLKGWHVAFFVVGIPGLIMALWVRTLKEPLRGQTEGITNAKKEAQPFKLFFRETAAVLPPFTIWSLWHAGAGRNGLALNLVVLAIVAAGAAGITAVMGDAPQWAALGVGLYGVVSWIQALRLRDPVTFEMIFKSRAMIFAMTGFGFIGFKTYGIGFWLPPFFIRAHELSAGEVGTFIGLGTAFGGWAGVTFGGVLSDKLRARTPLARLYMGVLAATTPVPFVLFILTTSNVGLGYFAIFINAGLSSCWIGSAVALANELVLPRMRATASSFYILMVTFVGLAMGPYTIGRISDAFMQNGTAPAIALRYGQMIGMSSLAVAIVCFAIAGRYLVREEETRLERARAAGEQGI